MVKKKVEPKEDLIKLEIGCGQNKEKGWVGIDIVKTNETDIVYDLNQTPWPIKTESVSEARALNVVEHLDDLFKFYNELYRILTPGGTCFIVCPYYSSMRAMQDPTHKHFISEATFLYANQEWRKVNKLDHYPLTCDFDFSYGYFFYPDWQTRNEESRNFAIKHYINVVSDIQVILTKRGKYDLRI